MRLHHLATGALVALLPSITRADAGGGIARLSAVEPASRPGRLLRSSSAEEDGCGGSSREDRSHHGPVQLTLLDAAELIEAASIELSLPSLGHGEEEGEDSEDDEILYTYDLDWRDEAAGGWHGRLRAGEGEGDGDNETQQSKAMGTAHFVASPLEGLQENRLAGVIHRGDGMVLRITTKPDGTHWYESWDDESLGSAANTARDETETNTPAGRRRDLQDEVALFGDDDGSVIDHLSVYTRRAMCQHALVGFYPCPLTPYIRAPIEEFIALQITVTNYVLDNTHVPTRLNSVHVFMDPDYDQEKYASPIVEDDPERSEIGVALSHLKTIGSGHFEEARRRQNLYCADVVTLFATIGLGLAGGPYNVVNHGTGGWGFAHEIGHSINAGHRSDNLDKNGYGYGYGYGPDDSDPSYYATIMAFGGKKVPMYSTPDYTWDGKVMGTATENNRQSIIDMLVKTANRRRSEMCKPSCEYGSDGTPLGCPTTCSKCHFPPDFCYDDPFFRFEDEIELNCEWVRFHPEKCGKTVNIEDGREWEVSDRCPVSCNTCPAPTPVPTYPPNSFGTCEDDPSFLKHSIDGRGCDWVTNDIERCGHVAGDGYLADEKIYDYCRLTCNMCHLDNTPPPSTAPCADLPGNHFGNGQFDCDWIGELIDVRCDKYSKALTHCPETCGLCDAPTSSPTVRGPCADDEDWVYEALIDKYSFLTCEWVREDPGDRCQHSRMKHHCPVTCGTCCEDEPGWYKGINGSGGGNPESDCAYYGEIGCGNAAMDHCERTCGLCPNHLANAGGPDPNVDYRKARHLRNGARS